MSLKVLVTNEWIVGFVDALRRELPAVEFIVPDTEEQKLAAAADAEVALGSVTAELLAAAPRLKWVQSGSAGVEWIPPELAATDIVVTNTRGAHAATIAEHAFGMLIALARRFDDLRQAQRDKVWLRPAPQPTVGLAGLTMGVIGLGNIGRAIAVRAHAFEMPVIAVDAHPVARPDHVAELGLLDGLDDLLRRADVVAVATPITDATRGMLSAERLALLKPTAYLLGMSRGGIIDEAALVRMLREGALAGAGLDVTAVEPLPADSELWDAPNILISPHSSPTSARTGELVGTMIRRNLQRYLAGEPLENVVDKSLKY
ncbi:MAG: D-2-hydroxyacid dehydrogenase [Spirochaetaceae bacterium]|nr:D-2-hydroxyacid dehydrogenase [Spirochaetaceae bacterium]